MSGSLNCDAYAAAWAREAVTMVDNALAAARERFAEYRERVSRMPVSVDCRGEPSADFRPDLSRVRHRRLR